jgi:sugar transferase (PEP-CTERM system associated)
VGLPAGNPYNLLLKQGADGEGEAAVFMRVHLFGHPVPRSIVILAMIEAAAVFYAMIFAHFLHFHLSPYAVDYDEGSVWARGMLFTGATFFCTMAFGLYSGRQRARTVGILFRVMASVAAAVALTAVGLYLIPHLWIGRPVLGIAGTLVIVMLLALRLGFLRLVGDSPFKRHVLVYGAGRRAASILRLRRRSDRRGFVVTGFVRPPCEGLAVPSERLAQLDGTLLDLCRRHDIDEVVVAMEERRQTFPIRELLDCRLAGIDVIDVVSFLERETGRVRIDVLNPSWLIFGQGFKRGSFRLQSARVFDLLAASALLVLSCPCMLAAALAIKLEDGWRAPLLYVQERVGFAGRVFKLLKFRSMRVDAEAAGQALWAKKNDSRVTRVGGVIRKLRIDELPQILNVLKGEMGLVGPRPERPQFVQQLTEKIPYYVERLSVKPGITGWAQLCYPYGASERDALEKLQYDLYYIKNGNLLFDIAILVQTAEVVLMGKGAR